ncbi:hypothetical protein [Actinophytocola sp.]|uniref:hypothetical protein n=1 Tax=Actinophytocola sp. TaxID=1872138 RepID=UPI002D7EBEBA|nr:hypothetical protein [Actinophytocola sp.]HET9144106.1 hypothetical protein [Actinophytocola sp.]
MKTSDIQPRTWYGTKEKYGHPQPILVHNTDRYSVTGWNFESMQVFPNPNGSMTATRSRRGDTTGYLAVRLQKPAWDAVQRWIVHDEDEQAAHDVMREAALLLDKAVAELATRGRVPLKEMRQDENDQRGLILTVIHPRDLDGDYATVAREKHERDEAAKQARENQERAIAVRYDHMVATLTRAKQLGLNIDRYKGGVTDSQSSYARHTRVEMAVETFDSILDELDRLRGLVAETMRADETGESGHD